MPVVMTEIVTQLSGGGGGEHGVRFASGCKLLKVRCGRPQWGGVSPMRTHADRGGPKSHFLCGRPLDGPL